MREGKETFVHRRLKEFAVQLLKEKGCIEIQVEHRMRFNHRNFRIDVVGFSAQKKFAVECGNTSAEKLQRLKEVFDDVTVLTVNNLIDLYEGEIGRLQEEVNELKAELGRREPVTDLAKLSKHIQVTEETWKWLAKLKVDLDAKSFDEVIQRLRKYALLEGFKE